MKFSGIVSQKIKRYGSNGNLDHTAKVVLALLSIRHGDVRNHAERVALLAEKTAERMQKDKKAAFFGGLLHDIGKLVLPFDLFEGRDISADEYAQIKTHALGGFEALKKLHVFTAYCAGLHHALYKAGYGLQAKDLPNWNPSTVKKILEISAIISVCDFVDAFTHRATKIKDGSDKGCTSLREMLVAKYPDDREVIGIVLQESATMLKKEQK